MFVKLIILISALVLIKCENESTENPLNKTSPQTAVSEGTEGERRPKSGDILDILNNAIGSAAAGAINAVSDSVVREVIGSKRRSSG